MLLDRVYVKNFRSIEEATISFEPRCRVLVGINETGKSNILRALSLLSPREDLSVEDMREALPGEDPIKLAYVRFVFKLQEQEIDDVFTALSSQILSERIGTEVMITVQNQKYALPSYLKKYNEALYTVNLKTGKRLWNTWNYTGASLAACWKKPSSKPKPTIPGSVAQTFALINIKESVDPTAEDTDYEYFINNVLTPAILELATETFPECIYWKYDEDYLLPGRILLSQFSQNPETCLPLKHMFELAGHADIPTAIAEAKKGSKHAFRNLLTAVSKRATKHIRDIWKEYNKIEIKLEPYGDTHIDAGVKDAANLYEMQKRSDGFKRFLSFLLIISARVKTKDLSNTLLLIDEPENGLHPSGARYLRDELLAISKYNYVLYSTHSTNMIDREQIQRHFIVRKDKEKTRLIEADESNFVDEEVLLNALGTSAFEILKDKNIIFEGWKDKRLFEVAIEKVPKGYTNLSEKLKTVGKCHGKGVKDLRCLGTMLELANRSCFIVSDDDEPAKQMQREHRDARSYGTWMRYSEILAGGKILTGEDFVSPQAIAHAFNEVQKSYPSIPKINEDPLACEHGRLNVVRTLLSKEGLNSEECKAFLAKLKDQIFDDLKPSHIENRYYTLLSNLRDLLFK